MQQYELSRRIYELRKQRDLSQKELGALVGVSNKAVSKWETGAAVPKTEVLLKLADVFGVSPEEFLVIQPMSESSEEYHPTLEEVMHYTQESMKQETTSSEAFSKLFTRGRAKWYLILLVLVAVAATVYMLMNASLLSVLLSAFEVSAHISVMFTVLACATFTGVWYMAYIVVRLPFWMKCVCLIGSLWLFAFLIVGGLLLLLPTVVKCGLVLLKGRKSNG